MPDDLIRVISPDGNLVSVPTAQLRDAESQGFRVPDDDEIESLELQGKYGDQSGRAFLEGTARGLTLGASDVVQAKGAGIGTSLGNYLADLTGQGLTERATGRGLKAGVEDFDRADQAEKAVDEAKAEILGRQQANAAASTAGEVTGALGLGLLTGGLGTSGFVARGTTLLGKAGRSAAAGAFEGAAYGAAKAVDDDFLNNREITAERIALGARDGALLGGALGGGMSVLGAGLKAAGRKASDAYKSAKGKVFGTQAADAPMPSSAATADAAADASASAGAAASGGRASVDFDAAVTQQVDEVSEMLSKTSGDASVDMDFAFEPLYQQQGALVSRDLAEEEIGKAAKVFAQARAAEGGFEAAQQEAVRAIGESGDEFMKLTQHMDDKLMIPAKRRAARRFNKTELSPDERARFVGRTADVLSEFESNLDRLASYKSTLNEGGGKAALKHIRTRLDDAIDQFQVHVDEGKLGDAAMVLDDLKRSTDRIAARTRNNVVREFFQGDGEVPGLGNLLRRHLEDESVFAGFATMQRKVNATLSESIKRGQDDMLRGILYEGGESSANPFRRLKKINRDNVGSLLKRLGDEEVVPREEAFRKWLRAREIDAINRAKEWGGKEQIEMASKLRALREEIESRMNAVALSRRNKQAWEQLTRDVDLPGPVGWAMRGGATLTQKVAGYAESRGARSSVTSMGARGSAQAGGGSASAFTGSSSASASSSVGDAVERARSLAVEGEQTIDDASSGFTRRFKAAAEKIASRKPTTSTALAGVVISANKPETIEAGVQQLSKLSDPTSDERMKLSESINELTRESPEHGAAMQAYMQRSVDYLLSQAPKGGIDLSKPFGHIGGPKYKKREAESFVRKVAAAQNPSATMQRIAEGTWTPEDLEVIRNLHPATWARFVAQVQSRLSEAKTKPSYADRLKMSRVLGAPMTAFERQAFQQAIGQSSGADSAAAAEQGPNRTTSTSVPTARLASSVANIAAGSDRAIARGE